MTRLCAAMWLAVAVLACKRDRPSAAQGGTAARGSSSSAGSDASARLRDGVPVVASWYRAALRSPEGIEIPFFLGVPAAGVPGMAVLKVGAHEVRTAATFDGHRLRIPIEVHRSELEATVQPDGHLRGTFSSRWRAWGMSSAPVEAVPITAPTLAALTTVEGTAPLVDLGAPRTVWRVTLSESGTAKLTIDQAAPGELVGLLELDTGNRIALVGNGRGGRVVLAGFDGATGFRIDLQLGADHARGDFLAGNRFSWRETFTAVRGADFVLAVKPRP